MSRFAEKKDERLTRAAAHRATWTPEKGSWYDKLYQNYHRRKHLPMNRQGRCEYFHRVIRQMLYLLIKPALIVLALVALTGLVWVTIAYTLSVLQVVAAVSVVLYGAAGFMIAVESREKLFGRSYDGIGWIDDSPQVAIPVLGLLFLPGFAVTWLFIGLGYGFITVVDRLSEIHWIQSAGRWFFKTPLISHPEWTWVRPWLVAALLGWGALNVAFPPLLWASLILGFCVLMLGAALLVCIIAESREAKQKAAREKVWAAARERRTAYVAERLVQRLFAYYHPEYVDGDTVDGAMFAAWLVRYERFCGERYNRSYRELSSEHIFKYVDVRRYQAQFGESTFGTSWRIDREYDELLRLERVMLPAAKTRQPSWVRRAWRITVEFLAFIGAFIRTLKWKVCPVAEVSRDSYAA